MELNWDLYQQAFSKITLSEAKREEILNMTEQEQKRRKPIGRRMLVAAVTALLAAMLAMGANAASDGELGEHFIRLIDSRTLQNGTEIEVYEGKTEDNQNEKQIIIKNADGEPSYYATFEIRDGGGIDDGYQLEYVAPDDGTAEGDGYQIKYNTKITPIVEVENNGSESVIRIVDSGDETFEYSVNEENDTVTATYDKIFYYMVSDSTASSETEGRLITTYELTDGETIKSDSKYGDETVESAAGKSVEVTVSKVAE